ETVPHSTTYPFAIQQSPVFKPVLAAILRGKGQVRSGSHPDWI
ncbi:MAG: hypothetical protein ACI92S_005126, partial [Planctomycetaceae bacterium]